MSRRRGGRASYSQLLAVAAILLALLSLTGLGGVPWLALAVIVLAWLKANALPWLARDNGDVIRALFPQLYAGFRERYATRLAPEVLNLGAGIVDRLDASERADA